MTAPSRGTAGRPRTLHAPTTPPVDRGAAVVLLLSFLPLTGSGMTEGTRAALALMHVTVGAALVAGLPARPDAPERRVA